MVARGAALWDAGGQPFRFAGSHTDITDRKLAETELRVSREKLETLVNSIDGIVWESISISRRRSTSTTSVSSRSASSAFHAAEWLATPAFLAGPPAPG